MNFALSSSHTRGSSSKRVLILQADERHHLINVLKLKAWPPRRFAIAPSLAPIWPNWGKKQSYVPGAGELIIRCCVSICWLVGGIDLAFVCLKPKAP